MKKHFILFNLVIFFSLFPVISQETEVKKNDFIPQIVNSFLNLNLVFDEGVSYCQLTRIEKLEDRSNFVRETMMAGPFFQLQTVDFSFIDYMFKISAYYPVYSAFNGMKQKSKNMFNYAINAYLGMVYTDTQFGYINLNYSLGLHYMFQVTDEWFMHYVGLGGMVGLQIPLTKGWSIIESNFIAFDNPNLGKNRSIQPFDAAYQFQIDLGVRYSKRCKNGVYVINPKSKQKPAEE